MKRALGIEVGRAFASLCEVTLAGDGAPRRHRFARLDFPAAEAPTPEQVADTCLRLALENGVRGRSAVLTLARELTYVKPVQLPPLPAAERLRLVSLQPERFFPISERRLVCDLEPLSNGALPVAHAADAEQVEELVEALQSRGFRITAVLPAPAALMRAATRGVPSLAQANWLLVRVEGEALTANAYQALSLRSSRRVENFRSDPLAACREISRTASQSLEDGRTVDEVRWPGWSDLPETFRQLAAGTLPVPVRDLPELPGGNEAIVAYGAALAGLEETPQPDLLPPTVRARRRQQGRWLTVACTALLLVAGLALLWSVAERQEKRLRRLDEAIVNARTEAAAAAEARDRLQELEDRVALVQRRMQERAAWMRLLGETSSALPEGAWVASLSIEPQGEVNLSGYASRASALIPALETTEALADVELSAPATRANVGTRELEAFNIRAALAGSPADSATAGEGRGRAEEEM